MCSIHRNNIEIEKMIAHGVSFRLPASTTGAKFLVAVVVTY